MDQSPLKLIKRCIEYLPINDINQFPRGIRGIYVLYKHKTRFNTYDVVYVGMTKAGEGGGVRGRLRKHKNRKAGLWTHCSVYEVWDNIRDEEIVELEGLFRHIYRYDSRANSLNVQRGFKKIRLVRESNIENWK
ncbi:MAG: GIY-YIG nuclease family protein [Bacteroidetes bacterium]|nr:GIY-YIG nuclease family protein [Bacteroidota bacterium]MCH8033793.1 GIY-YIG nuclease family protein [Bacteroidota bacterium]MCH9030029.1 GIY-YIG nuclease family protein [Bacteroidota bacterium]